MRGESQAGQNSIRKNAEIVTERDIEGIVLLASTCNVIHMMFRTRLSRGRPQVRQEAKPDVIYRTRYYIPGILAIELHTLYWYIYIYTCASLLFPDGASMSRTDKALLVCSLYRVASLLIRVLSCWNMAISTHLQGYKVCIYSSLLVKSTEPTT